MALPKAESQIEKEMIQFIISRIETFQRIDYEMMLELIASKNGTSIEYVKRIVDTYLKTCNSIIVSNSSFIFNTCNEFKIL